MNMRTNSIIKVDKIEGGEHIVHCTDDVLYNCTPENYIILLSNVTPRNSINKKQK